MRLIQTNQAPSAKPGAISLTIPDVWTDLMDGPSYDIPKIGFSSDRRVAPGIVEISSPLLVTNPSPQSLSVSVRIIRLDGSESMIAQDFPVPNADALIIPIQGQFLLAGDVLSVKASVPGLLSGTISYTEGQAEEDNIDVS